MLSPSLGVRHEQRTVNFNATTSLFSYGALNANYNANLPQTWLALIRPTGAGESNFGYVAAKVSPSSATGMRWIVDHNAGSPRMIWGVASGTSGPSQSGPSGSLTYNRWVWVAATYAGGLSATSVKLYQGLHSLSEVTSYPAPVDGSGSIDNTVTYNFVIGNRDGGDRTFAGDIAMVVRWDAVLTIEELEAAIRLGPLSVRRKTILSCFAGGQDISPHKLRATTVTARGLGRHYKYPIEKFHPPLWLAEVGGAGAQNISPGGIESLEAFGSTSVIPGAVSVSPSSIDSLEAFGSTTVSQGGVSIICSGIATEEAFGTASVVPGQVSVVCSGIASAEAFGDAFVSAGGSVISVTGIASLESFGAHTVTPGAVTIAFTGVASAEAFGATTIQVGGQFITAPGIESLEAFGAPMLAVGSVTIICSGISSAETFGSFVVTGGVVTQLEGLLMYVIPKQSRIYTVQ